VPEPARLRVLVLGDHVGPSGGTGAHAGQSIAALHRRGHEVVVGAMESDQPLPEDVPVRILPGLGANEAPVETRAELSRLVREVEPDVVHVQQLPDGGLLPLIQQHCPLVFDVHNYIGCPSGAAYFRKPGDECGRAHGTGCVPRWLLRGCAHVRDPRDLPDKYARSGRLVRAVRRADVVVAHSAYLARHLRANGVDQPVHVPLFVAGRTPTPAPDPPRVLFAGRITAVKGVGTLIKAAAAVDAEFVICGDGWWEPKARRLAEKHGVADRVMFHGWLGGDGLAAAYDSAAIVVVPSHWPEPFGLVGLEAMAHGRPVVASATGGIPEWLADGETGLLVRPGDPRALADALQTLIRDPQARERMGASGAERVAREFSEEHYIPAIEGAYQAARRRWRYSRDVEPGVLSISK
jgi:glycosyltransferase involved in cell wall biosynthesis